jgi:hypothetical protein
MGQAADGAMVPLSKDQFEAFLKHGSQNMATVGDVFMIRGCYFEVETISEYGISAKGISEKEYVEKKMVAETIENTPMPKITGIKLQDGNMI